MLMKYIKLLITALFCINIVNLYAQDLSHLYSLIEKNGGAKKENTYAEKKDYERLNDQELYERCIAGQNEYCKEAEKTVEEWGEKYCILFYINVSEYDKRIISEAQSIEDADQIKQEIFDAIENIAAIEKTHRDLKVVLIPSLEEFFLAHRQITAEYIANNPLETRKDYVNTEEYKKAAAELQEKNIQECKVWFKDEVFTSKKKK
ncbi:MAG: hypothetical protein J6M05_05335 [Cardiobacteriaceae bacterium]|nr:hypothetical protein [Cardiobacteriaceae bacterium]